MEHYYLLAVICCFLPFIVGGIWLSVQDTTQEATELKLHPSPVIQGAEDLMLREYYYSRWGSSPFYNKLLKNLKKVNLYDPTTRPRNYMDDWFLKATPRLMHNGMCLAYINNYGHLEDSFWKNMKECNLHPEQDIAFQKLLVSVGKTGWGCWTANFPSLLFSFGKQYELLPEIINILETDPRFEHPRETYKLARQSAERNKLKAT